MTKSHGLTISGGRRGFQPPEECESARGLQARAFPKTHIFYQRVSTMRPATAYHIPHELDWMGNTLRRLCRRHRPSGQGRRGARRLKPGHGSAHQRGRGLCLGHRLRLRSSADRPHRRNRRNRLRPRSLGRNSLPRPPHPALSRPLRPGHRPLLAMLLPRPATRPRLARRPSRQAQRPPGHPLRLAPPRRKTHPSNPHRRPAHYRRCRRHRHGVRSSERRCISVSSGVQCEVNGNQPLGRAL